MAANGAAYFRHKLGAVCRDTQYANNLGYRPGDRVPSIEAEAEIETGLTRLR